MIRVRRPSVAATFYPASAVELESVVALLLADVALGACRVPKAIVAPHAGYAYSGAVAASAYARVRRGRGRIERVVVVGPAHYMPVDGLATAGFDSFTTPLGELDLDAGGIAVAEALACCARCDMAHVLEHSVEVHLPFLIATLGKPTIIPLVVGTADDEDVARVLDALWGGEETLIVVSSDLSHDLPYEAAHERDAETTRAIEAMDPSAIDDASACGGPALRGLLRVARARGLDAETLDVRSSGDTAGERGSVVGYGAYAFA
jgi:AmmeMemoRadiSam system protein B